MRLKPCCHCWKDACDLKNTVRSKLKGAGLVAATIACRDQYAPFPPGTRVSAQFTVFGDRCTCYGEPIEEEKTISGTVMGYKEQKVKIWLDEKLDHGLIVRLYTNRLRLMDEPRVMVCPLCGRPEGKINKEHWWCEACSREPMIRTEDGR